MVSEYRFERDRATIYWTVVHVVMFVVGASLLFRLYEGGIFSAWFIAFGVALVALMTLSIPRRIVVDDSSLSVVCLLDVTHIKIEDIVEIRKISPRKIRWVLPLFAGVGFLGYYGYFFDFKHLRRVVIYATQWRRMVEIVDIYEDHYYLSCHNRDALIEEIEIKRLCN